MSTLTFLVVGSLAVISLGVIGWFLTTSHVPENASEHNSSDTVTIADQVSKDTFAPADPGAENIFSGAVYDRGAMTLYQLRLAIGDDDFFELLRTWAAEKKDGNAETTEFIALAEKISGQQLDELFEAWLYTPSKPVISSLARKATPQAPKSWAKIQQTHELLHKH